MERLKARSLKKTVWSSQWLVALCTFYRQILYLAYRFFPFETSAPGLPGSTCIYCLKDNGVDGPRVCTFGGCSSRASYQLLGSWLSLLLGSFPFTSFLAFFLAGWILGVASTLGLLYSLLLQLPAISASNPLPVVSRIAS